MKRFGLARHVVTTALVAAAFAPAAQAAGAYSNVIFFGDSLTDAGAFYGVNGAPQGNRWTTRKADGSVNDLYADILARKYGYALKPVLLTDLAQGKVTAGGNDFAEGGGVMLASSLGAGSPATQLVSNQIGAYLGGSGGKADPNALYMVWAGNNDLAAALQNPSTAQATAVQAADATVQQVKTLQAAGAKHIIVGNAVDLGRTPLLFNTVATGVATAFYAGVNNATTATTIAGAIAAQINQSGNAALIGLMSNAIQTASGQATTLAGIRGAAAAAARTGLSANSTDLASSTAVYQATGSSVETAAAKSFATTASNAAVDALLAAGAISAAQAAGLKAALPAGLTPTLAATPGFAGAVYSTWSSNAASATALASSVFNSTLNAGLGKLHNVVAVDAFKVMSEVMANPKAFGFDNVTGTACPAGANACVSGAAGVDDSKQYFFADVFHPTPQTHAIVAQVIASTLDAPYYAAQLVNNQPVALNAAQTSLDERAGLVRSVGALDGFARVSRLNNDQDANAGALKSDGSNTAVTVGLDYQYGANTSLGVAFTQAKNDTDFAADAGGFKATNRLLSLFGRHEIGAISVLGDVYFGSTRFDDVHRNVTLGALHRVETGDASGSQVGVRVAGSYLLSLGTISLSPTVSLAYRENKVGGYAERCADVVGALSCSTSMRYDGQRVDSLLLGAGVKFDAKLGSLQPFGSAMFYHDSKDKNRMVEASLVGQSAKFETDVFTPDSSYGVLSIGARAALAKGVSAYASYNRTVSAGDEKRDAISLGLQASF